MERSPESIPSGLELAAKQNPAEFHRILAAAASSSLAWDQALERACLTFLLHGDNPRTTAKVMRLIRQRWGIQAAYNLLKRVEIVSGVRPRLQVALFDHTLQLVGGGQKYGCTMAHVLQETCDVTLVSLRPVTLAQLEEWYDLDLSGCRVEIISIPFYERGGFPQIDPGLITVRHENPFHPVAVFCGRHDIFINNSMLEMVYPLANVSAFVCHFPERRVSANFFVDRYRYLVCNSEYTAGWIQRKWKIPPTTHIYPPADMAATYAPKDKEKLILSVARFEPGGSKQQDRMVDFFAQLRRERPQETSGWRLVLAGGTPDPNPYLEKISARLRSEPDLPVELKVNITAVELRSLYRSASIFWHLCGLRQSDPSRVEHFGMTIVEAMQNGCVPVVFDGGGQKEIVEDGESGFRFATGSGLLARTSSLLRDPLLREKMAAVALARSRRFSRQAFEERVRQFFAQIVKEYAAVDQNGH